MSESHSILIADDQAMALAAIQAALELEGYKTFVAKDGIEALEILDDTPIDIIIADVAMPRMNGYQLYKAVRQDPRWVRIPFIFLTARSMASDIRYGKELGADDYLTKPFHLEDLRAIISGKLKRIEKITRIAQNENEEDIVVDTLRMSPAQHRFWIGEIEVSLSVREYALLLHLARNAGKVVSLETLCQVTHDLDTNKVEAGSLLYPLIRSLRMKFAKYKVDPDKIQSVRGVGYCLV